MAQLDLHAALVVLFVLLAGLAAYAVRFAARGAARFARVDAAGSSPLLGKDVMQAAYWCLQPFGSALVRLGVSANGITGASLALGLAAGIVVSRGYFGLAAALVTVAALGDALDGLVARRTGTVSAGGALFDASVDRYQEFFFLAGVAIHYRADPLKLALVLAGKAPDSLLDSYDAERIHGADENILNSTRSTDFITPKTNVSRRFRDAVLELSEDYAFARPLVNSGRLSTPTPYVHSSLNTPDESPFKGRMAPGVNCADAPVIVNSRPDWFLRQLDDGFTIVVFGDRPAATEVVWNRIHARVKSVGVDFTDAKGVLAERYDAEPGTVYLIRPDQHVAARWRSFDEKKIAAAIARACAAPA